MRHPDPRPAARGLRGHFAARLLVAAAMGALGGVLAWHWLRLPLNDYEHFHTAAWIVARGGNPYDAGQWPLSDPYYYPLPVAVAMVPLAALPLDWSGVVFLGLGSAAFAFGLTRSEADGPWPLLAFATPAFLIAARLGQWTPLLAAAALLPALRPVFSFKPSLGLALFAGWPSRWAVLGGAALAATAFALLPSWPLQWYQTLAADQHHIAPVNVTGGVVLLAAALRWRRPEGRLLVVLACVPQVFLFADQLLLTLIPRTARERLLQALLMWVGFVAAHAAVGPGSPALESARPYVLVSAFLPALVMVLRRPNEGAVPAWIDAAAVGAALRVAPLLRRARSAMLREARG